MEKKTDKKKKEEKEKEKKDKENKEKEDEKKKPNWRDIRFENIVNLGILDEAIKKIKKEA